MPKYSFKCGSCGLVSSKYTSTSVTSIVCLCSNEAVRLMPTLSGADVKETVNKITGISWKQDQEEIAKKRRDKYYWEVEVPRLVQKYSLETCLEQKWLIYNDKGELVINNKPPDER